VIITLTETITVSDSIGYLVETPAIRGDANDDGKVNALDITKVERIIGGLP
jgi:hypothetical protein